MRPRIFVTQPVAKSAIARLRKVASVTVNPDALGRMTVDRKEISYE